LQIAQGAGWAIASCLRLALCFTMVFRVSKLLWPSLVGFFGNFLGAFFGNFLGAFLTTFWSVFRTSLLHRHLAGFATIYGPFLEFWVGFFWLLFLWAFFDHFLVGF
jgi:hypothetical protein